MNTATLRAVTSGDGTSFPFIGPPVGLGTDSRQATIALLDGGVAFTGPDVSEAGTITLEHDVIGTTPGEALGLVDRLVAAWAPSAVDLELALMLADRTRIYLGRPLRTTVVVDEVPTDSVARVQCVFSVRDRRGYHAATKSVTVAVGGATGGFDTPVVTPIVTTGSGSSGDAAVANDGTAPTGWVAALTGGTVGVVTPRLILGGRTVQLDAVIPAGSVAIVSSDDQSVTLDGQPRPWVAFTSDWWDIPPGLSTFSYRATSGDGTATLTWRDASHG